MKNIELLELNLKLSRVNFNDIKDGSFQYAISKNRDILKRECRIIEEAIETLKPSELSDIQKELKPLVEKLIKEKTNELKRNLSDQEINSLQDMVLVRSDKYDRYTELIKEFKKLREPIENQENNISLRMIKKSTTDNLPLNDFQMSSIFPIIIEEISE